LTVTGPGKPGTTSARSASRAQRAGNLGRDLRIAQPQPVQKDRPGLVLPGLKVKLGGAGQQPVNLGLTDRQPLGLTVKGEGPRGPGLAQRRLGLQAAPVPWPQN